MSPLESLLAGHQPFDEQERADLLAMQAFATSLAEPFSRSQWPAHFTGSAVVVDTAGERVCLLLHAKLNRWLQPGGHSEPVDAGDLSRTALREAREETGLTVELVKGAPYPLDVDAHVIPARKTEPEHQHLDVRFLLQAAPGQVLAHDTAEATGSRWLTFAEAAAQADEPALRRLLLKAQRCFR